MAKNVTGADMLGGMFAKVEPLENNQQMKEKLPEKVLRTKLHPFRNHPFRVVEDEQMEELAESIKKYGIQEPILVRPDEAGGYEIVSGHRRCHAAAMAGMEEVPVHIREMSDSLATVLMVDSNNKREVLLPSEKAWAYRMKADALKCQGRRNDLMAGKDAVDGMAAVAGNGTAGESVRTVERYIRLTYLMEELLQLCDSGKISIGVGYTLSYFSKEEQMLVVSQYKNTGKLPDAGKMKTLNELRKQGELTGTAVQQVFEEKEKKPVRNVTMKEKCLNRYFPADATKEYMENVIVELLEQWAKKQAET